MRFREIVVEGAVVPRLTSTKRDDVIRELAQRLVDSKGLPAALHDEIMNLVIKRENRGSTGFGHGVAVPHAKHPALKRISLSIGVSDQGIDFNALDKKPTHLVFLLLSPEDRPEDHIDAMKAILDNLQQDRFRSFLRQATTVADVITLLDEADARTVAR